MVDLKKSKIHREYKELFNRYPTQAEFFCCARSGEIKKPTIDELSKILVEMDYEERLDNLFQLGLMDRDSYIDLKNRERMKNSPKKYTCQCKVCHIT